jgi:hypothetical protein
MNVRLCLGSAGVSAALVAMLSGAAPRSRAHVLASSDGGCPPDARCFAADPSGKPDANGSVTAQCTGIYPDFVTAIPSDFTGSRFRLSQTWPKSQPKEPTPWAQFDFRDPSQAGKYGLAVRDYAYDGMLDAGWRPELNTTRQWFHVPWMTTGRHPREASYGMTDERVVFGPELGVVDGGSIRNYAVGYYNAVAGYALGQMWGSGQPSLAAPVFPEGSAVVKILFSAAAPSDFAIPDPLQGAPGLPIIVTPRTGAPVVQSVRLLQLDFAVRDHRAGVQQWVFGTFAFDRSSTEADPWRRMALVGLMWGNDPNLTPAAYDGGARPVEGWVNPAAPSYARQHLGWEGRVNGPVDNPVSACLSCHGTAQFPSVAPLVWQTRGLNCSDPQKLAWFRDLPGNVPFGTIDFDGGSCGLEAPQPEDVALDFSLQNTVALGNAADRAQFNPCLGAPTLVASAKTSATFSIQAQSVSVASKKGPKGKTKPARHVYEMDR